MKRKLTLSIGISAYNEEQAFPHLLKVLLAQKGSSFLLDKIIVISDGSTDETLKRATSFNHPKVTVRSFRDRKGKARRINELFSIASSDILVLLDADIQIKDTLLLEKLVISLKKDEQLVGVSGSLRPIAPKSFVQKIIYTGSSLWDKTRSQMKYSDVYYCTGAVRAFRKRLYKEMKFPDISAEDVYPYLYCRSKGYRFGIVKNAAVYYGLPATYRDYFVQMRRYLRSSAVQGVIFGENLINQEYTITRRIRLRVLCNELLRNPFWTLLYIICLFPVQAINTLHKTSENDAVWNIAVTSKKLH